MRPLPADGEVAEREGVLAEAALGVAEQRAMLGQAYARAASLGINACPEDVGRLLRWLARHVGIARVAELGTGAGAGAAWILSGLHRDGELFTAELDEERATEAQRMFERHGSVRVLCGDWVDTIVPLAPFDLVYADGFRDYNEVVDRARSVVQLLRPGGLLLVDHQGDEILTGGRGEKPVPWPEVGAEVIPLRLSETVVILGARVN